MTPIVSHRARVGAALRAAVVTAALLAVEAAVAQSNPALGGSGQTIGGIAGNVVNSLRGAATLVTALCYLGALAMGFIGALKWKAYGEQPDRMPLKVPLTLWAVAVLLAALPEFLGTGIATLWNSTTNVVQPI